jgi:HSP20 family protein
MLRLLLVTPCSVVDETRAVDIERMKPAARICDGALRVSDHLHGRNQVKGSIVRRIATKLDENIVLTAEIPGLSEKDIQVSIEQDVLSITGERRLQVPKGYSAHRQERGDFKFARSIAMPCKVEAEKASATVRNGVLTVALPKVPEAQPKRIEVRAS